MTEISDSGHIHIMMCLNTIFMAHDEKFQNKLQGGRYSKLKKAAEDKNYTKDIIDVFPNWIPNRGMGFYFPKLKMELYGTPGPYAWFTVTEE